MAPRPKNPPPDRRQEILDAALRVFSTKGYSAATNADIAREAGVTAAALYYYFPSKADLFQAAITERRDTILPNIQQFGDHLHQLPPDMVLPAVIQFIVAFLSEERTQSILRIMLSEGPRNPEVVRIWQEQAIGQVAPLLLGYLQAQMDQGRIRSMDPRLFALMLGGPMFATVLLRDILKLPLVEGLTNDELAQRMTEMLSGGLILPHKE